MTDAAFRGIFGDRRAGRRGGAAAALQRRPDTLTELRWHQQLPVDCETARAVSAAISEQVLSTLPPVPPLEFAAARQAAQDFLRTQSEDVRAPRFVNVKTGMRLRYMRWGSEHTRTVIMLHDIGDAAGVLSGQARSLAGRGFCVYAFDCRGHGDSSRSADALYNDSTMLDDLESFVLELDLYTAPLALVGFGMGARVAACFAATRPALVGAVALCELWAEQPADATFHPGQAARFKSEAEAAAFVCAESWGHPPRPLAAIVRHNVWRVRHCITSVVPFHELKIDARFFAPHDGAAVRAWLRTMRCHAALLHGLRSHMGASELRSTARTPTPSASSAAAALHDIISAGAAASVQLHPLPAGHFLLEDAPLQLRDALVGCLTTWAALGALDADGPRTPESLGLRPLQQFASLEEAARALRPRDIPTRAVVEAALAALDAGDDNVIADGPAPESCT